MGFLVSLSVMFAACGDGNEPVRRSSGGQLPPGSGALLPLPIPGESPGGATTPTEDTGNTFFDLIGPALPAGANVISLRATLTSTGGQVFVVSSVHLETQFAPTPVSAGTYTLTFLNENDTPTTFTQSVVVSPGIANTLSIGSVLVDPSSAVQPARIATASFPYAIGITGATLKTVVPTLNTVIDLPAQSFAWQGIGVTGLIPLININAGTTLLTRQWGSVLILKEISDTISILSSNGALIFPATVDGVEYLLPATPQSQGCMVYLAIINSLTTRTLTLCSDGILHIILNER